LKQSHCADHAATEATLYETEPSSIAVVDPDFRTRRQMSRVIRRLGHRPMAFASQLELMQACCNLKPRLEAVVVACPGDLGAAGALISRLREQVGPHCPLLMSAGKRGIRDLAALHARASDRVEVTPSSFEEAYLLVKSFLQRRQVPVANTLVELGLFRLDLSKGSAEVAGTPVKLTPNEFDLAIAFFKNVDRVLNHHGLRSLIWENEYPFGSRVLTAHVCSLRRKLGLGGAHGLELRALPGHGYRLSAAESARGTFTSPMGTCMEDATHRFNAMHREMQREL
jgi:two-component system, OmpR family, phosphate regulon response regulator PhoB